MNKTIIIMVLLTVGLLAGIAVENQVHILQKISATNEDLSLAVGMQHMEADTGKKKILYWVAPMDPNYRRSAPGKSPMGMDLIPVYGGGNEEDHEIVKIKPEVINNLGVRTARVERRLLRKKIATVGYLDYDETRISHIHTRTEGWIEKLQVRAEGQRIKRDQLLFALYSPALVNAQEEYLHAVTNDNRILVNAAREKLIALGVSRSQIESLEKEKKIKQNIGFYAPQSGVLINLGVREGMYIKPETEVLSIANLDSIWLLAEVFERQADWVKVGQMAEARLPSFPDVIWKGNVEYIYPDLDPVTRTLRLRLRFDNAKRKLMPNMYAHVTIFCGEKDDTLSVPRAALIRDAERNRVIIALGDGQFRAQEVVVGMESGDMIEIMSGLKEDDEIVISSQFLIDSESSLKASLQRMQADEHVEHNH